MSKLNKNSNGYIFGYAIMLTLVCGTLLAVVSQVLNARQKAAVLLEKQQFILNAGMGADQLAGLSGPEVTELYNKETKWWKLFILLALIFVAFEILIIKLMK